MIFHVKTTHYSSFTILSCFVLLVLLTLGSVEASRTFQKPGGRDPGILPTNLPRRRASPRRTPVPVEPKLANVTLIVSPADSTVWLGIQQIENAGQLAGKVKVSGVKPDNYTLIVRHAGYTDQQKSITLNSGDNDLGSITLQPLKGLLSVKPNIDGSVIEVRSIDQNSTIGSYARAIDKSELSPGEYEVTISKPGYQSITRTITIKAGETSELEPRLDPLPTPTPTPTPSILRAPRSSVTLDGKYLIVRLIGTSGASGQTNGTLNVTVNRDAQTAYVQGSLNGLPCTVSFAPGDNVAEGSLIDSPNSSNAWSLIGVRIRPKDPKQPVSFSVNWSALQVPNQPAHESQGKPQPGTDIVTKAVTTHIEIPSVPLSARSSRTKGLVKVSVEVDEVGNVISAKAFDGPMMLRQAAEDAARGFKFKPATRNGVPIRSTEVIYFTFEGY